MVVRLPHDFSAQFHVRDLIITDWNEKLRARLAINHDVGALQHGVAEEPVVVKVLVLNVFERLFVGWHALQPAQRRHHGQQQVQFRVLWNHRLLKKYAFLGIQPRRQIINHDLQRVFRDRGRVRVIAGQRVPIGDEVEAVVGGPFFISGVLQAHPILQCSEIMPDVQPPRRPHPAEHPSSLPLIPFRQSSLLFSTRSAGLKPGPNNVKPKAPV